MGKVRIRRVGIFFFLYEKLWSGSNYQDVGEISLLLGREGPRCV